MKAKILVADDDVVFLNALLAKLAVGGFEVKGVQKGKEIIKIIKDWKPDLIILDLILPDIHGLEILSELRENQSTKTLPVIVCTNVDEDNNEKKSYSLGAKEFLLKVHFSLDQLVEKIEEASKSAKKKPAKRG